MVSLISKNVANVAVALVTFVAFGVAQDKPKPAWKDQAEFDLASALNKDPKPDSRLASLDKWSKDYPNSDFQAIRRQAYLITYQQLNKPKEATAAANDILQKDNPNDELSLRTIVTLVYQINPPGPADLDTALKASNYILENLDKIYAADKKPANQTADQWTALKPQMKFFSQRTVGWVAMTRKDDPTAEAEFVKALQLDPTQAAVSNMLASVLLAQQKEKPEKLPLALFQYARASAYDGPNSLPAASRAQLLAFYNKAYASYHGSAEGGDKVLAAAKATALPPANFHVDSVTDIAVAKAKADDEAAKANPMMALWTNIKKALTADDGQAYFESGMKDSELPGGAGAQLGVTKFKGQIVSMTPATRPKELVLAVEKPGVADVTLKLDEALPGKMEPGEEIEFEAVATSFTKEPYMVNFDADKDKIAGWTGKNAAPVKKAVPKKKAE